MGGTPAFVVLHDAALEAFCLAKPATLNALRNVSGFGDKKVDRYGRELLELLERFRGGERPGGERPGGERPGGKEQAKPLHPRKDTLELLREGRSFDEIA